MQQSTPVLNLGLFSARHSGQKLTCGSVGGHRQLPVRRSLGEGGSTLRSFNHFFELLIEHPNAIGPATADGLEAIDGDVKPVALFAFHDEVSKT